MNLSRFLDAQDPLFFIALAELRAGAKRGHWMWFVFPQLRGLGRSETARFHGIENADEAAAYLAHPVLGARLRACAAALLDHRDKSAREILGSPDDLKLRSCLTLFRAVAGADDHRWQDALDRFHDGEADAATLRLPSGEA